MVGNRIGPYKLLRESTEDALGQVFEALDLTSKKTVLIRALKRETAARPETVSRLYSEAKTLALLNHPHIARIFGFIRQNDQLFLVMEFVEGETLQSILKANGRLEPEVALAYFHQVLSAVAFAHKLGVIHGDLQPTNIIVTSFGQIKILDFAIALLLGDRDPAALHPGIASYLAPEQLRREPIDERSDIYSLGVLLYESLVGRAPFDSDVAAARVESTPLPPSLLTNHGPVWLDKFILRALAPSPSDRFQTASAMSQAMHFAVGSRIRIAAKQQRRWPAASARRLRSVSQDLLRSVRRAHGSITHGLSLATANLRENHAAAASVTRNAIARINPSIWMCSSMAKLQSDLESAAAALEQAKTEILHNLATRAANRRMQYRNKILVLGGAASSTLRALRAKLKFSIEAAAATLEQAKTETLRDLTSRAANLRMQCQKKTFVLGAAASSSLRALQAKIVMQPITIKQRLSMPRNWRRGIERLPQIADRALGWGRAKISDLSEAEWRRYAAIAVILASVTIEIFVFGGANTLLMSDQSRLTVATQHGAAEAFLDPLPAPEPRTTRVAESASSSPDAKPAKRTNIVRKNPAKTANDKELAHEEARVAKRTVTYRADAAELRPLEANASESIPPRRTSESNVQLNVKWEN